MAISPRMRALWKRCSSCSVRLSSHALEFGAAIRLVQGFGAYHTVITAVDQARFAAADGEWPLLRNSLGDEKVYAALGTFSQAFHADLEVELPSFCQRRCFCIEVELSLP